MSFGNVGKLDGDYIPTLEMVKAGLDMEKQLGRDDHVDLFSILVESVPEHEAIPFGLGLRRIRVKMNIESYTTASGRG